MKRILAANKIHEMAIAYADPGKKGDTNKLMKDAPKWFEENHGHPKAMQLFLIVVFHFLKDNEIMNLQHSYLSASEGWERRPKKSK